MPQYVQSSKRPFAGTPRGANRAYWESVQGIRPRPIGGRVVDPRVAGRTGGYSIPPQRGAAGQMGSTGNPLLDAYNAAFGGAREANLQRYANLLEQGGWRYGQAMDMIGQMGGSQRANLAETYGNRLGAIQQDLAARGLGNTSIPADKALLATREYGRRSNELEDLLLQQRLGAHTGLSGDIMGVMERRTDEYPDVTQLMGLAQAYGQGVGGGGGGMGGGGGYVAAPPIGGNPLGFQMPGGGAGLMMNPQAILQALQQRGGTITPQQAQQLQEMMAGGGGSLRDINPRVAGGGRSPAVLDRLRQQRRGVEEGYKVRRMLGGNALSPLQGGMGLGAGAAPPAIGMPGLRGPAPRPIARVPRRRQVGMPGIRKPRRKLPPHLAPIGPGGFGL